MTKKTLGKTFDIESSLTYRISKLFHLLHAGTSRRLKTEALVTREWRVLALLAKPEPVTASDLVARSPMDKASVSRAVAGLLRRKLVAASAHSSDGRAQQLQLTAAGRRFYKRIAPASIARQSMLMAALTTRERKEIYGVLDKLIARADALVAVGTAQSHATGTSRRRKRAKRRAPSR